MDSISPSPRSRLISPPARRIVRLAALLLGVATFAAACTSSSSADTTPDVVESSPSTQADAPEVTLPSTTEAAGDLAPVPLPERKIVSDGGAILEITEARRLTIARTGALEIGQDPSEADKFGRFDLGAGRSVIAIVHHGDDTESVLFVDNDASVRLSAASTPSPPTTPAISRGSGPPATRSTSVT